MTTTATDKVKSKRGRKPGSKNKPKPVTDNTMEVLSAEYGIEGKRVSFTPILGKKLTNKMAGSDPAKGEKKNAIVRANVNGSEVEKSFAEGEVITF